MRRSSISLLVAMLASACAGGEAAELPETTQAPPTTVAPQPTTTALKPTTTEPPVVTTTTAHSVSDPEVLKLVEDYVAAFFTYDSETFEVVSPLPGQVYLQESYGFLNYEVLGDITCEAEFARPGCTFVGEDDVSRLLGFQYAETWLFFIPFGDIATVSRLLGEETQEVYSPFRSWVSDNMPGLFTEGGVCGGYPFEMAAQCAAASLAAVQEYMESDNYPAL